MFFNLLSLFKGLFLFTGSYSNNVFPGLYVVGTLRATIFFFIVLYVT